MHSLLTTSSKNLNTFMRGEGGLKTVRIFIPVFYLSFFVYLKDERFPKGIGIEGKRSILNSLYQTRDYR